jgi:hypothetical protein
MCWRRVSRVFSRSDDDEVVCRRVGGEFDFEHAIVRGLFSD